jgi:glycine C-acetyltransferase
MPAQTRFLEHISTELSKIEAAGTLKAEVPIMSPQGASIQSGDHCELINLCSNNYLGLAQHPEVVAAARAAIDTWGIGLASVRFICGTQLLHQQLEEALSRFLSTEATILYSSCFDANGGLFETLLGPDDAIISDSLNHASIIDGIRLSKAQRFRYKSGDLADLRVQLDASQSARFRLIATDGVFSMDGTIAPLADICQLADEYDALVMVDDCHATGFIGPTGRGTPELFGVQDRIDILTGTLGKALGGTSGGYTTGKRPIIELLRQRSRPYLFSNTLAPPLAAASLKAIEILEQSNELPQTLHNNARYFREQLSAGGLTLIPGSHPISPVMLGDAALAGRFAKAMRDEGVLVIGFSFPVVPVGQARIRTQVSAAHSIDQLDQAAKAFVKINREMSI